MKKVLITVISSAMLLSLSLPGAVSAQQNIGHVEKAAIVEKETTKKEDFSSIGSVQKFVFVNENGHLDLKNASLLDYKKFDLASLELHFETLNNQVDEGKIIIHSDLTIESLEVDINAVYGSWTNHWWGYDRNFTNSQAITYVNDLNTVAYGGTMVGIPLALLMPIVGGGVAVTAAYYGLLATRVQANNNGSGVYVGITWARVFNVNPL